MNLLHDLPNGSGDLVMVVVEIPKGSRNKYEYDRDEEVFKLDRVLYSPFFYPFDYGFVPKTWYEDGDPIDAMVYSREPTFSGCVTECRVVGLLRMEDEHGIDDKLLVVPTGDPLYNDVKDITDIPSSYLEEVAHFFERYKDLEKGKTSKVVGWFDKEEALKALEHAKSLYKEKFSKE